jgi:hypothetical protein
MIGVDTLQANLTDCEVLPGHKLVVNPASFSPTTGETFGDYVLWDGQQGRSAHFNDERGRFFVDFKQRGSRMLAAVHLSVPKYATGGNNAHLVGADVARDVFADLQKELYGIGIATNLSKAQLSRVDVTRNIQASESFTTYKPVLQLVKGQRLKDRREYMDGFLWGNTRQQVCTYDKGAQVTAMGGDASVLRNVLRFEYRMRDAGKCKDVFGFSQVGELLAEYDSISDTYRTKMKEHVFRFTPNDIETMSGQSIAEEIETFMVHAGRNWKQKLIEAYGVRELVKIAEVDTLKSVIEEKTGSRKEAYRFGKKLEQGAVNAKLIQHDTASRKTYRTLYNELKTKVLSRAA